MKVLIACEESQEVCKAFRRRGHEAYSCDIQEPSGGHPEWHILGDAVTALRGGQIVTMNDKGHYGQQHKGVFTTDRAKNRAKTFTGVANAMSEQWG